MPDSEPGAGPLLVSVVIPTHNRGDVIGRALDSVLAQDHPALEILVVDDGSTDATAEILARYGDAVRSLQQENAGRSGARNAGVRAATGGLIAFLDSDDEWRPGHLSGLVAHLAAHPEVGLAYRQAEFFDDAAGEVFDVFPRHPQQGWIFLQAAEGNPMLVDTVLVRRSVLDEVGLFDEELDAAEDWELWVRCLALAKVAFVPGVTVRVHYHGRNTMGDRDAMERGIRAAVDKMLSHPANGPRLAPHRRRIRAGMWALLAHMRMLDGDAAAARARLLEGLRDDPGVAVEPAFWSMAMKVLAGPSLVHRGRLIRRRLHLRRVQSNPVASPEDGRHLSIVVPCFRARRWLPDCLESLRSQTRRGVEIIVVDGGSQDGTVEWLEAQEGIRWVSERDEGQSDAIGKGFAMASGEVVCWVNADDRLRPGAWAAVADAMRVTGADLVIGSAEIVDAAGSHVRFLHPPRQLRLKDFVNDVSVPQPSTFFTAELVRRVDGLDPTKHLAFDSDLWIRFLAMGARVAIVPAVLSEIIYHEETKTSTHTHAAFRREAASALEAWGGPRLGATMQGVVVATQLIDDGVRPDRAVEGVAQALAGRDDELVGAGSELVRRAARAEVPRLVGRLARAPRPMQRGAAQAVWWRLKTGLRSHWLDRSVGGKT